MILRIGLLFAGSVLFGQVQTQLSLTAGSKTDLPSPAQRVRLVQRRFPPEIWSRVDQAAFIKKSPSYCISRSPENGSLLFRSCQPPDKMRFLQPVMVQPQRRVQ